MMNCSPSLFMNESDISSRSPVRGKEKNSAELCLCGRRASDCADGESPRVFKHFSKTALNCSYLINFTKK